MTLEEILTQMGSDKNTNRITYEEARTAYESDESLRKAVIAMTLRIMLEPEFQLVMLMSKHAGMDGEQFAKIVLRAVVEAMLTED